MRPEVFPGHGPYHQNAPSMPLDVATLQAGGVEGYQVPRRLRRPFAVGRFSRVLGEVFFLTRSPQLVVHPQSKGIKKQRTTTMWLVLRVFSKERCFSRSAASGRASGAVVLHYTVSFARPFWRRRATTRFPVGVFERERNPWVFARFRFFGW